MIETKKKKERRVGLELAVKLIPNIFDLYVHKLDIITLKALNTSVCILKKIICNTKCHLDYMYINYPTSLGNKN